MTVDLISAVEKLDLATNNFLKEATLQDPRRPVTHELLFLVLDAFGTYPIGQTDAEAEAALPSEIRDEMLLSLRTAAALVNELLRQLMTQAPPTYCAASYWDATERRRHVVSRRRTAPTDARQCLDMGCGTGVQGIVMALHGARSVVLSDISLAAVRNTEENLSGFHLGANARVLTGDLFERIDGKYDVMVFNHPFFVGRPSNDLRKKLETTLAAGAFIHDRLEDPHLIHRFLGEAKNFLRRGGTIIMPFYHLAGTANDPAIQGEKHGYQVFEHFRARVVTGLQRGVVSVYRL